MSLPLSGKVAIVTGSSRSIGAAIARRLAKDGASVVISYVSDDAGAKSVVDSLNALRPNSAISVKADISKITSGKEIVEQTLQAFGKIDILVLNAGIMGARMIADVDEEFYDQHFAINVKGPFFLTQAAAPHMTEGGRIIFISSSLSVASDVLPFYVVYVASKGAVEQLTRALCKDLGPRGITVNTVSPGPTNTDLLRAGLPAEQLKAIGALSPHNRLGEPDEIASVVNFVAGPESSWVNGQNYRVNGGWAV